MEFHAFFILRRGFGTLYRFARFSCRSERRARCPVTRILAAARCSVMRTLSPRCSFSSCPVKAPFSRPRVRFIGKRFPIGIEKNFQKILS